MMELWTDPGMMWMGGQVIAANGAEVVAKPGPSPVVIPQVGDRLCRLASQHVLSDYNQMKRVQTPPQTPQSQASTRTAVTLGKQMANLVTTPVTPPERLAAPPMAARSRSAPQVLTQKGVVGAVGGYINAIAGSLSSSFAQPFSPFATPSTRAPTGERPSNKRKPRTQDPSSDSPTPSIDSLPHLDAAPVTPVSDTKRILADAPFPATKTPESVPMAPADSSESTQAMIEPERKFTGRDVSPNGRAGRPPSPTRREPIKKVIVRGRVTRSPTKSPTSESIPPMPPLRRATTMNTPTQTPPPLGARRMTEGAETPPVIKTSETHPMNISPILPTELLEPLLVLMDLNPSAVDVYSLTGAEAASNYQVLAAQTGMPIADPGATPDPMRRRFGNLLLSSCPGKKIRLENNTTPEERQANGNRAAICRDLGADFARAAARGAKAVVCCLDDGELAFLGSPWEEYYAAATEAGLLVLRCPMAEGFAPQQGVREMDALLEVIVNNWTLKGEDVLCHCRGGVGRAGLVACCWLLKCGLVPAPLSVESALPLTPGLPTRFSSLPRGPTELCETVPSIAKSAARPAKQAWIPDPKAMRQVECIIEVVRRRRSVKSIETPHQVHFLVAYTEYLQALSSPPDV